MYLLNNKVWLKLLDTTEEYGGLIVVNKKNDVELCEVLGVSTEEIEIKVGQQVLVAKDKMAVVPQGRIADRKDILAVIN